MKIKELIKLLQKENPESLVILQKDSEGNGYSPLYGINGDGIYIKENSYSGIVYDSRWNEEEADMEKDEWEKLKDDKNNHCVVLFPAN